MIGINATADATNRLAVKSAATLFDNAGAGHQHKINKAAAGDTASLLFQAGSSGRAEMGLAGDDNFHVKVSADGMPGRRRWSSTARREPCAFPSAPRSSPRQGRLNARERHAGRDHRPGRQDDDLLLARCGIGGALLGRDELDAHRSRRALARARQQLGPHRLPPVGQELRPLPRRQQRHAAAGRAGRPGPTTRRVPPTSRDRTASGSMPPRSTARFGTSSGDTVTIAASRPPGSGRFGRRPMARRSTVRGGIGSGGASARLLLWNAYNRVPVGVVIGDSDDSWSKTSSGTRSANASDSMRCSFVTGLAEDEAFASYSDSGQAGHGRLHIRRRRLRQQHDLLRPHRLPEQCQQRCTDLRRFHHRRHGVSLLPGPGILVQ